MNQCEQHTSIRESGIEYVRLVSQLIEHLLEYRATKMNQDSRMNLKSCTVNLIDFYERIGRDELYVKYLTELKELHEKYQNSAEAGFTILKYAQSRLLDWRRDQPVNYQWKTSNDAIMSRGQLKEKLYREIITKFDEGKMWEKALEICEELMEQYKCETFEYSKMAELLQQMSIFYKNIMTEEAPERLPEYYR